MAIPKYQFLSDAGIKPLATALLDKANIRIDGRIVTNVDGTSTDNRMPSAKTLYDIIHVLQIKDGELSGRTDTNNGTLTNHDNRLDTLEDGQVTQDGRMDNAETGIANLTATVNALTHLTIKVVTGAIESEPNPSTDILYFQRDDESDTSWMLYVYTGTEWITINTDVTEVETDLTGYWNKNTENDALKEALGMHNATPVADVDIVNEIDAAFADTNPS